MLTVGLSQFTTWLAWWRNHDLDEANPHEEEWLQHPMATLVEDGWTADKMERKKMLYKNAWSNVLSPAFAGVQNVISQKSRDMLVTHLNTALSHLEQQCYSLK